jgi:myo-inositol-1(or 4)-monophosphatase
VLVREAGGTVTDLAGGDTMLATGKIVASNGLLHAEMLDVLRRA